METREQGGCVTAPRQVCLAGVVGRESVLQASISLVLSFVGLWSFQKRHDTIHLTLSLLSNMSLSAVSKPCLLKDSVIYLGSLVEEDGREGDREMERELEGSEGKRRDRDRDRDTDQEAIL